MGERSTRREARERALSLLYEAETKDDDPGAVLAALPVRPNEYTVVLVEGVAREQAALDELIVTHSPNWPLDRMPALDRALLRLGVYELVHQPTVPTGVVLSEAVELAAEYSTDDSARFVNGVLAQIGGEVRSGVEDGSASDGPVIGSEPDR